MPTRPSPFMAMTSDVRAPPPMSLAPAGGPVRPIGGLGPPSLTAARRALEDRSAIRADGGTRAGMGDGGRAPGRTAPGIPPLASARRANWRLTMESALLRNRP